MKYRKKPVVVEAVRFTDTEESILKLSELGLDPVQIDYDVPDSPILKIETLEGLMIATKGDYIIMRLADISRPKHIKTLLNNRGNHDN